MLTMKACQFSLSSAFWMNIPAFFSFFNLLKLSMCVVLCLPLPLLPSRFPVRSRCSIPFLRHICPENFCCLFQIVSINDLLQSLILYILAYLLKVSTWVVLCLPLPLLPSRFPVRGSWSKPFLRHIFPKSSRCLFPIVSISDLLQPLILYILANF